MIEFPKTTCLQCERIDTKQAPLLQGCRIESALLEWANIHYRIFPWRKKIPLWRGILVEVLLQRTRASQVVPVFEKMMQLYPNAASMKHMTDRDSGDLLKSLGLNWRVPIFTRLANELGFRNGRVKRDPIEL